MAIVNVPAPRRADISPVLNFMLQMSAVRERKETRKLQKRQIDIDEAALGISRERLPSQILQAKGVAAQSFSLAAEADARVDAFIKETDEKFNVQNTENRRQIAVLAGLGVKEDLVALKRKAAVDAEVHEIWKGWDDDKKADVAHADAIGKLAQGEIRQLTAATQNLQIKNLMEKTAHQIQLDTLTQQTDHLVSMESTKDRVAANQALKNKDENAFNLAMAGELAFRDAERAKGSEADATLKQTTPAAQTLIDPVLSPNTQYGEFTLGQITKAQNAGQPLPETRTIRRPAGLDLRKGTFLGGPFDAFGKGKEFIDISVEEARLLDAQHPGVMQAWNAAGPADTQQQPTTTPTTVKQGVRDAVKKTTPVKKAAPAKSDKRITREDGKVKMINPQGNVGWVLPNQVDAAIRLKFKLATE